MCDSMLARYTLWHHRNCSWCHPMLCLLVQYPLYLWLTNATGNHVTQNAQWTLHWNAILSLQSAAQGKRLPSAATLHQSQPSLYPQMVRCQSIQRMLPKHPTCVSQTSVAHVDSCQKVCHPNGLLPKVCIPWRWSNLAVPDDEQKTLKMNEKPAYKTHTNLAFTDASCTMAAVAVDADLLRDGTVTGTCNKWTLVLCATLITALVECVAMQFRQTVAWNSGQSMQAISVLADNMLQHSQRQELMHSLVRVCRLQHRVWNVAISCRWATCS